MLDSAAVGKRAREGSLGLACDGKGDDILALPHNADLVQPTDELVLHLDTNRIHLHVGGDQRARESNFGRLLANGGDYGSLCERSHRRLSAVAVFCRVGKGQKLAQQVASCVHTMRSEPLGDLAADAGNSEDIIVQSRISKVTDGTCRVLLHIWQQSGSICEPLTRSAPLQTA